MEILVSGDSLPIAATAPLLSVVNDNIHTGDKSLKHAKE